MSLFLLNEHDDELIMMMMIIIFFIFLFLACWDKPSRHEDIRKKDENNELQHASW